MRKPTKASRQQGHTGDTARYRHPVPDSNALLKVLAERKVALTADELCQHFSLRNAKQRDALVSRLTQMAGAGQLVRARGGAFGVPGGGQPATGVVLAQRDGGGYLRCDDGGADLWMSQGEMRQLLDGDRVAVRPGGVGPRGQKACTVLEILARGKRTICGRFDRAGSTGFVTEPGRPARRFLVADGDRHGAKPGQYVTLEVTEFPTHEREAEGRVLRVLGDPAVEPSVATDAALEMFGLPGEFPVAVRRAAAAWGTEVRNADIAGRVDLRMMPLVTIDGADARDFDDAVFAEPQGDGWRLVVAIADVSHYVRPADPLDVEAGRRGTSAYFPDRVVPMLPEQLSNGLCSLNPQVDRLCMVCDMQVGADGEVTDSRFYRAVMRSRRRLIYEDVQAAHEGIEPAAHGLQDVREQIGHLYGVYGSLAAARTRRGALDLELPETKIELAASGHIEKISLRHRNDAHRLIEECMIAANVEAARFLRRHRLATLYRVHAGPTEEKFEVLRLMLQSLGIRVSDAARSRTRDFNVILAELRARPDYSILATAVLRSMAQAVYQPENIGHFGLALGCYAHFTSPIRRYPDLLVHRGIGHVLDHARPGDFAYPGAQMADLGRRASEQERRVDEAARFVTARYKCAFVRDRIGESFAGTITGVTGFGLFVMLDELGVDGLIHISTLGRDFYNLRPGGIRLEGERTGQSFSLGDRLEVRIVRVDVEEARVDLALAGAEQGRREPRAAHSHKPRRKP